MKSKGLAVLIPLCLIVGGLSLAHIILPDAEISGSERRKLDQMPAISAAGVFSGGYFKELESYLQDQFPLREQLRTAKALTQYRVFMKSDSGGYYTNEGGLFKLEYPLDDGAVLYAAGKINSICSEYLQGNRVFYSVIPDKNYFTAAKNGYPAMDYERLFELMQSEVEAEYIDITDTLEADDYFATDLHWRQERLEETVERLAGGLGVSGLVTPFSQYELTELSPFYGVYCGQTALPAKPETLFYLTDGAVRRASVKSAEIQGEIEVYDPELFFGTDPYNVYLSGAQAVVTIENPDAESDRELIIFRDSFASSLAPLFINAYKKITLVDLRYMSSSLLPEQVDFNDADVLFIYSTLILNNGRLLR